MLISRNSYRKWRAQLPRLREKSSATTLQTRAKTDRIQQDQDLPYILLPNDNAILRFVPTSLPPASLLIDRAQRSCMQHELFCFIWISKHAGGLINNTNPTPLHLHRQQYPPAETVQQLQHHQQTTKWSFQCPP